MGKTIAKIINLGLIVLAFLVPLFFLPITPDFYGWNKLFLLFYGSIVLLLLWLVKVFSQKKLRFRCTPLDRPILLFGLIYLMATLIESPNKLQALLAESGLIFVLTVLYFLITHHLKTPTSLFYALIASASLLSWIAIYQFIGVGEFVPWDWMKLRVWTPAGSPLNLVIFLLPVLTIGLLLGLKTKETTTKIVLFLLAAMMSIALLLVISLILPGKEFSFKILPLKTSWQIGIEAFKRSPLLGTGPGRYLMAFTRYKPIEFNASPDWQLRFVNAGSYYLHLLTTVGVLGLVAYLFLVWKVYKAHLRGGAVAHLGGVIALIFILQLFLPSNLLQLFLLYLLLAIWSAQSPQVKTISFNLEGFYWLALVPIVLVAGLGYLGMRAYLAEYYYQQSLEALAANKGKETYDLQRQVIRTNPYLDYYHRTYSQTNLGLANSLAAQAADLTDQDRTNIQILIQQAIREAKLATVLGPGNIFNWENLANLYRSLINVAVGAENWAVAALRQAIWTDPINPRLRVNLGGLFYALGNYDQAIEEYRRAVDVKPDYANAYYNLAAAYREKGEIRKAVDNMEVVLNLVEVDSGDYQKAKAELEELKEQLPEEEKPEEVGEPETLKEPESLPSPMITPPLELPEEAGPEITPSPEASPSPTPSM